MKRSTERFLTTHTGSLPRPDDLVRMMFAKEDGVPVDRAALDARIRAAVAEIVKKQADAGVDIVNDGEMSKVGYATYIKDRCDGFGGESVSNIRMADVAEFPGVAKRLGMDPGRKHRRTPACNAAIRSRGIEPVEADIANLKAAVGGAKVEEGFMSAASPGVVAAFFVDQFYGSRDAYLAAIADVMKPEYEAIAKAGFVLQIDCPDLAMSRHNEFPHLTVAEFRREAERHVEALNEATKNIPPEKMRIHLCWGNYDGPHHHDVPMKDIIDIVFKARPQGISFEAANPRHAHEWAVFEDVKLPDGKYLIPGVLESKGNFIEHPVLVAQRLGRYAKLVGRENVMAGSDCGFGTFVGFANVDPGIVWAKLATAAEGARLATKEFWGR